MEQHSPNRISCARLITFPTQVYLLAEIIKAAPVSSNVLFGIIREAQIQPKWNDIALPQGTSHQRPASAKSVVSVAACAFRLTSLVKLKTAVSFPCRYD